MSLSRETPPPNCFSPLAAFWLSSRAQLILLIVLVAATFFQVGAFNFVNYDDPQYVYENPRVTNGLTPGDMVWALCTLHGGVSYWHPLTWLSHQLDCQLFGLNPGAHHLTNAWLHVANTLLILALLRRLGLPSPVAFLGAGLFGLHPLHVESVAWVAERKDVLCAFFWLAALLFYVRYREGMWWGYSASLILFLFALMAKPMAMTLPVVLVLLDLLLPAQKRSTWLRIVQLAPFFLLSAAVGILTCVGQSELGDVQSLSVLPLWPRMANAFVSYALYVRKFVAPYDLCAIYLHPGQRALSVVFTALLLLGFITWLAIRLRPKEPLVLFGWLLFLVTLLPTIGIIQVGAQALADRYMYLPMIGLILACGWPLRTLLGSQANCCAVAPDSRALSSAGSGLEMQPAQSQRFAPLRRMLAARHLLWAFDAIAFILLAVCGLLSVHQLGFWRNSVTLYERVLRIEPDNWVAHLGLSMTYAEQRRFDEAIPQMEKALSKNQNAAEVHYKYGVCLYLKGDAEGALQHWQAAIEKKPSQSDVWFELANAYATCWEPAVRNGRLAVECAERGRALRPSCPPGELLILAAAYAEWADFTQALRLADAAIEQARDMGDQRLVQAGTRQRELYVRGQAFRADCPK